MKHSREIHRSNNPAVRHRPTTAARSFRTSENSCVLSTFLLPSTFHPPESLEVWEGDLHPADVDDGFVETHHQAVCLVLERLNERV